MAISSVRPGKTFAGSVSLVLEIALILGPHMMRLSLSDWLPGKLSYTNKMPVFEPLPKLASKRIAGCHDESQHDNVKAEVDD